MLHRASVRYRPRPAALRCRSATDFRALSSWSAVNGHGGKVPNFINGEFMQSSSDNFIDVVNPVRHALARYLFPIVPCSRPGESISHGG